MKLIETRKLSLARAAAPVLNFPDMSIEKGRQLLLLGPSGSGKTTLLSILAGLLRPTAGEVFFNDENMYAKTPRAVDRLRGEHFGLVFQTLHLLPTLTLKQNIDIASRLVRKSGGGETDALMARLGLADKADRRPDALSQGEQQRASIARAVVNRPSIILADEPTSALDDENAHIVTDLLIGAARETGAALIVSTHDARVSSRFDTIVRISTPQRIARP